MTRYHHDLEFLVSSWSCKIHTFVAAWGEFTLTLEDVARLTTLLMFGEVNAIRTVLEEEDDVLRDLTFAKTPSRMSTKSTYVPWAAFFKEGMATEVVMFWRLSSHTGYHGTCYQWPKRRPQPICFPLSHSDREKEMFTLAPLYLGSFYAWLNECVPNMVRSVETYNFVTHVNSRFLQISCGSGFLLWL